MTILWAGTSIADLEVQANAVAVTTGSVLSPNVAEGFSVRGLMPNCFPPAFEPRQEIWFSGYHYYWTSTSQANWGLVAFYDDQHSANYRINQADWSTARPLLQVRTGANTWTTLATGAFSLSGTLARLDIQLRVHATNGVFRLYVNGVICAEFLGDTRSVGGGNIIKVGLGSNNDSANSGMRHSACVIADEDTRPFVMYQRRPTGNGAETSWSGDYTSVDETGYEDSDFISSATVDQVETFTFPALPGDMSTRQMAAIILAGRSRGSGSPGTIRGVARIGSTNYDIPGEDETPPGFGAQQWIFETNPATGLPWLGSEVNSTQFGVKST